PASSDEKKVAPHTSPAPVGSPARRPSAGGLVVVRASAPFRGRHPGQRSGAVGKPARTVAVAPSPPCVTSTSPGPCSSSRPARRATLARRSPSLSSAHPRPTRPPRHIPPTPSRPVQSSLVSRTNPPPPLHPLTPRPSPPPPLRTQLE